MIDDLKDISANFEDAESAVARYDSDGVISFRHTDKKNTYQQLFEDFKVLHRFTGKVGDIVDRTIDQPFYEDIDAFVAEVQQLSISNYKTKNRIGVTNIVHLPGSYESMEVLKTEVGLDDLFSSDSFYAEQMKLEYEAWKQLNADQDITQEDYQMGILNTRAFGYESIRDTQENREFWGNIAALVVIIGVTVVAVVVPPVGIPLALGVGGLYGSLELGSAVSGKDWISGRELGTGERWFRGALAPLDIVPGAMAVKKFSGVARTASLGTDLGKQGMKTSLQTQTQSGIQKVNDLAITAGKQAASRLKSAGAVVKERALEVPPKLANGAIEAGRVVDKTVENLGNLFRSKNSSHEFAFAGDVGKQTTTKPRSVEDTVTNVLSNIKWLNIEGKVVASNAEVVTRLIPGTPGNVTGGNSTKLGQNLLESMGLLRSASRKGYQAQHIIPKSLKNHPVLKKIGMDMDHADNGIFLPIPAKDPSALSRHRGFHSVYNNVVKDQLDKININQNIMDLEQQVFELQLKLKKGTESGLPLYKSKVLDIGIEKFYKTKLNEEIKIWQRGGGATEELWERWLNK
jgi:hypothetical protein